jgi:hypothetical protein
VKTEEEFRIYYNNVVDGQVKNLSKLRVAALKRKNYFKLGIGTGAVALIIGGFYMPAGLNIYFVFGYFLLAGIFYSEGIRKSREKYESTFSDTLVRGLISFMDPDFEYDPDEGIPEAGFNFSNIFRGSMSYYSSDLVKGIIKDTYVKFSYVDASMHGDAFKGLFFILESNKEINGELYAITRDSHSLKSEIVNKLHVARPPFIRMDDADFNYRYAVYGTDPIETRYILTPAFMQRLLDFGNKTKEEVNLSYVKGGMFLSLSTRDPLFQFDYKKDPDYNTVNEWVIYLNEAFSLVDALNLNTRIWQNQEN